MDDVILANQQSQVEKAEIKNGTKDLQYYTPTPYPIFGKNNKVYQPRIQFASDINPGGNQVTFDVNTSFYNHLARLRFDYTLVTGDGDNSNVAYAKLPIAMLLVDYIRFMDNGVQMMEMKGAAYRALVYNLPQHKRDYILHYARPLNDYDEIAVLGNNASTKVHGFLPLLSAWYTGSFEKAINTTEIQTMQIEVKFKTLAEAGLKDGAITTFQNHIDMRYWKPEDKIYRELLDKNYVNPLAMETWDTIVEEIPCLSLGTVAAPLDFKYQSKIPYFTFKTIAYVAKKNMADPTSVGCPFQKIKDVSLELGGTKYFTNHTRSMLELEGLMNGMRSCGITSSIAATGSTTFTGAMYTTATATEVVPIDYSAICSENSNTGGAFFSKLNNPLFTVNWQFEPVGAENSNAYSLYLCHFYWRNTELNSGYVNSFA